MLFSSTVFLMFFLPCLLAVYFIVPQRFVSIRNLVLLVFSLVFYAWGGVRYLLLLFFSMFLNYMGGLLLGKVQAPARRRVVLIVTLALNLGLLGVFKYAGFAASAIQALGVPIEVPQIVLPVGISFFTFQGLSYVVDVYRYDAGVERNPLKVALYIALFPQLVAGPIVRYTTVERELSQRPHTVEMFSDGLLRFLFGFSKKMLLANTMGEIADQVFALPAPELGTALAWVGAAAYTLQIYFDFSAYSDMAIGLGKLFGFNFLENFNYPYIADSVTGFWRRWHISLSTWFRDYVYIPLGGNRCSRSRHILNLMITWSLTGLWHGANWTFVAWGVYYGVLLILEKYILSGLLKKLPAPARHLYTLLLVMVGWVLFRSSTIQDAFSYLGAMFSGSGAGAGRAVFFLRQYYPEFLISLAAILPVKRVLQGYMERHGDHPAVAVCCAFAPKALGAGLFVLAYMKLVSGSFNPFIYFQF